MMNPYIVESILRVAGFMLTGLVVANFVAPTRFNYGSNLASSSVFVRQVFYVHAAYLISILGGLAILCLGWPELLINDRMGKILCAYFALFWFSRVIVQLTYYDPAIRRENRFGDLFFLGVFLTLAGIFAIATFFP
jgi:hypothetical protein